MKKLMTLAAVLSFGFCLAAKAQTLLYQWAFTNSSDTFTNSAASYAAVPGTGNLLLQNVAGNVAGLTGNDSVNPLIYFTNSAAGPGAGPGVDAMGALVANGQGYSGGNSAVAIATNLNLGSQFQVTVTFWVKMGPSAAAQFPRFAQFYQTPAYDVGGKGSGNHNGLGASLNGWSGTTASQEQNGIAPSGSGQQNTVTISGNPALAPGFLADGATWYFEGITYDGTVSANNFTTWIGTLSTNVQPFVLSANYSAINFTTNASVMIGGNAVNGAARGLSSGAIADVRIYSGLFNSNQLEQARLFQTISLTNSKTGPATVVSQPVSGGTFVSGKRSFSVGAVGNPSTISYLWRSNGVALSGATNSTLLLTNVQLSGNGASFVCSVSNVLGGTNSLPAVLKVLNPAAGSYAQLVFTNKPYSLWLLNEPSNSVPLPVSDYANGHDGVAQDPVNMNFLDGPSSPDYPGFVTTNKAIEVRSFVASRLDLANPGNFPNTGMTICGWIRTPTTGTGGYGAIFDLVSDTAGGFGLLFGGGNTLNYQWGGANNFASGLTMPSAEWTFVALVISTNLIQSDIDNSILADTNATIYVGAHTTGLQSATDSTALNGDVIANGTSASDIALGRTTLAASEHGGYYATSTADFNGVAVFYSALSPQTITNLYYTGAGLFLSGVADPNTIGNLLLTYPSGTLQESTNLSGPFHDVDGLPGSPNSVPMTDSQHFYRLRN